MSNHAQREIPLLAEMPKPREVEQRYIDLCTTESQAVQMCFNLSGHTLDSLSDELRVNKGTLSKVIRGKAPLPRRINRVVFQQACGNLFLTQWENKQLGYAMVDRALIDAIAPRRAA